MSRTRFLIVLVVLGAGLYLPAAYHLNINWDEFQYLADVYRFGDGTLSATLQTFHVHLFGWLRGLGSNEIDQILAARAVYFGLFLVSIGCLYVIASRFVSASAALFAVLCFVAYSDVIVHATSFRFDGLALVLLLAAVALLTSARAPVATATAAGALSAVAILVTIKSLFFLPTVGVVLLLRRQPGSGEQSGGKMGVGRHGSMGWIDALIFAAALLTIFMGLHGFHRASLAPATGSDVSTFVQSAASHAIHFDELVPRRVHLLHTLLFNIVIWCLILAEGVVLLLRVLRNQDRREALLLLSFIAPLGAILIYRNAFPYFYVMLMPLAVVLCGVRFDQILQAERQGRRGAKAGATLLMAMVGASYFVAYPRGLPDEISVQRDVLQVVHELFPTPVPYIDRTSMIASFPKVGFFMSTWGFESYLRGGEPIFRERLLASAPCFLIANHPALILEPGDTVPSSPGVHELLPEDFHVLKENYISHWGPLYVAGKHIAAPVDYPRPFEILIPGPYTVETTGEIVLSGTRLLPGAVVELDRGPYTLDGARSEVTLRWGDHLARPDRPPPSGVLFRNLSPIWGL